MKVNNMDKFRDEIIKALKENFPFSIDDGSSAMGKIGHEDKVSMTIQTDRPYYTEVSDGNFHAVTLPRPVKLKDTKHILTFEEDSINWWIDKGEYYEYDGAYYIEHFKNRLDFAMFLAIQISEKLQ